MLEIQHCQVVCVCVDLRQRRAENTTLASEGQREKCDESERGPSFGRVVGRAVGRVLTVLMVLELLAGALWVCLGCFSVRRVAVHCGLRVRRAFECYSGARPAGAQARPLLLDQIKAVRPRPPGGQPLPLRPLRWRARVARLPQARFLALRSRGGCGRAALPSAGLSVWAWAGPGQPVCSPPACLWPGCRSQGARSRSCMARATRARWRGARRTGKVLAAYTEGTTSPETLKDIAPVELVHGFCGPVGRSMSVETWSLSASGSTLGSTRIILTHWQRPCDKFR